MKNKSIILFLIFFTACFFLFRNVTSCNPVARPEYQFDNFKNTPIKELSIAVDNEDVDKIKELVKENKMDVNYTDPVYDYPLLTLSIIQKKKKAFKALLECGANPNIINKLSKTSPFIESCSSFSFYEDCDTYYIQTMINYGADVNAEYITDKDIFGGYNTVLMWTIRERDDEHNNSCMNIIRLLVESGADINKLVLSDTIHTFKGYCAISIALIHNKLDVAKYLIIDKKANIPDYVLISVDGEKSTITESLEEYSYLYNTPEKIRIKDEIIEYLKSIGKK